MTSVSLSTTAEPRKPSLAQQDEDHRLIINGYLDTHITRSHATSTRASDARFFRRWFDEHAVNGRALFIWEAMEPVHGRERLVAYSVRRAEVVRNSTLRRDLGSLRCLFEYVMEWPYIPHSDGVTVQARYGRIEQPVLEYDIPAHAWSGRQSDAPFVGSELAAFYRLLHEEVTAATAHPAVAGRTYTMCVLAAETGLRVHEMCHLETERDLLFDASRVQTRSGKGTRGSGPRVRQTLFTPFAQATVRHYLDQVRPRFRRWSVSPYVFLSLQGDCLSAGSAQSSLRRFTAAARAAKLRVPPRFGWHSLRRTFATVFAEEFPGCEPTLMALLGHDGSPTTLSSYICHPQHYHEQVIDRAMQHLSK